MGDFYTIFGTGHRPDRFGAPPVELWVPIANAIAAELIRFQHQIGKPLRVWGGAAMGFDTWVTAGAILARRAGAAIEVGVIRPFPGHRDGWTAVWREWEQHCWDEADYRYVLDAPRWDYEPRNREGVGLAARASGGGNVWSGWDGRPGGGTAKTIGYAKEMGLVPDNRLYGVIREVITR